jgi:hypothetical protein
MELSTPTKSVSEETNACMAVWSDLLEDDPKASLTWREAVNDYALRWALTGTLDKDLMFLMKANLDDLEHGLTPDQKLEFIAFLHDHTMDLASNVMEHLLEEAAKMEDDVGFFLEDLQSPNDQARPNYVQVPPIDWGAQLTQSPAFHRHPHRRSLAQLTIRLHL